MTIVVACPTDVGEEGARGEACRGAGLVPHADFGEPRRRQLESLNCLSRSKEM